MPIWAMLWQKGAGAMRSTLLAAATREQRRFFVLALICALIVLVVCLLGAVTAKGALRVVYFGGLVLALVQMALCAVRLRRGRREDARVGGTDGRGGASG